MTGTEGTQYVEILSTPLGVLGYRQIGNTRFRVRIEPKISGLQTPEFASSLWKRPGNGGQNRFSLVVDDVSELASAIAAGSVTITRV